MKKPYIPKPFEAKKPSRRANFTVAIKKRRLKKQLNKCAHCSRMLYDTRLGFGSKAKGRVKAKYDHKNTKNWDNTFSNCQALCSICHDEKSDKEAGSRTTRKKISDGRKRSEAKKPTTLSKQLRKDKFSPFKIKFK